MNTTAFTNQLVSGLNSRDCYGDTPRRPLTFKEKLKYVFSATPYFDFIPPPPVPGKKTLILDLDETLIHTAPYKPDEKIQYFPLNGQHEYVYKRPGLDEFLKFACSTFDTFIFTAATKNYADTILDQICPFIDSEHRLYRDSCYPDGKYVKKDTSILNRKKQDFILVDDSYGAYAANRENTLLIDSWKGFPGDSALLNWLVPILKNCKDAEDVRPILSNARVQRRMSDITPFIL